MRAQQTAKRFAYRVLGDRTYARLQSYYWRRRLRHRRYPYDHLEAIAAIVSPADTVIDVGANVGQYSALLAGLVGPAGRVIAIEPAPRTFDVLTSVVSGLELRNVQTVRVALADVDGSAPFRESVDSHGLPNPGLSHLAAPDGVATVEVPVARLDTLSDGALGVQACAFLKIDVEGAELLVLRGAAHFLASRRPAILVEIDRGMSARYDCAPEDTFAFLEELGYVLEPADERESAGAARNNFLFRPERDVPRAYA